MIDEDYYEDPDAEQLEIEMALEAAEKAREAEAASAGKSGGLYAANTGVTVTVSKREKSPLRLTSDGCIPWSQVKPHNSTESCWVVIHGEVWDITDFLPGHPGGPAAVLEYAGLDATDPITLRHRPEIMDNLPRDLCLGPVEKASEETLHAAVRNGQRDILEKLLGAKADINAKDEAGETPMHLAAKLGLEKIVKFMLIFKPDLGAVNPSGKSAAELAADHGHATIAELITGRLP